MLVFAAIAEAGFFTNAAKALEDTTLRSMPLGSVFEILVASRGYIASHGRPETTDDLRKLDWISHKAELKRGKITLRQPAKVVAGRPPLSPPLCARGLALRCCPRHRSSRS